MPISKWFITALATINMAGCSILSNSTENIKLYVLDCGEIRVKDISLFSPGIDIGKTKTLTNSCYLISHPKGNLLWESGLEDELINDKNGQSIADSMFHLTVKRTLISQLTVIGIKPHDIDYVGLSHLHFDHTGNTNLFLNAKILLQQAELDLAFSDKAEELFFNPRSYDQIPKDNFIGLHGNYDVFNDGSITIISAPGHTLGHQTLKVNLAETGTVILSGDLYHFTKNREHQRVPAINHDKNKSISSMNKIEKLVLKDNAKFWIQHDKEQKSALKHAPKYYQ